MSGNSACRKANCDIEQIFRPLIRPHLEVNASLLLQYADEFVDELAAVGLPFGPNMRIRLLGGIPVALLRAAKPMVAFREFPRNTMRAVPTSPSIKVCTASWNSAARNSGSDSIQDLDVIPKIGDENFHFGLSYDGAAFEVSYSPFGPWRS